MVDRNWSGVLILVRFVAVCMLNDRHDYYGLLTSAGDMSKWMITAWGDQANPRLIKKSSASASECTRAATIRPSNTQLGIA